MTLTRSTALALALLVTAGCGGGGGTAGGLSESVASRRRMPSCGSYTASAGALSAGDEATRACFLDALGDGTAKEVTVTATTMEGDAIVTIYRVLGRGDVELFVDASADKFAAVKASHQRCTSVAEDGNGLAASGCVTLA